MDVTLLIFLIVYLAMGFGHIPGFKVDRTGAALIGAFAMIVAGRIGPQAAWNAIDYRTIGMLFGLMVVSAAFVVSGFYALRPSASRRSPSSRRSCSPSWSSLPACSPRCSPMTSSSSR